MGIFRETTDEEKEQKNIIKAIRNSYIQENFKDYWITYVNGVYAGTRTNDFFDKEYLIRVILEIVSSEDNNYEYAYYTAQTSKWLKTLLPDGKANSEYQAVMDIFVNNYMYIIGEHLGDYLLNGQFIALFDSKKDAIEIILNLAKLSELDAKMIFAYALEVAPYCMSQDNFKKELLSFINGIKNVVENKEEFYQTRLNEAKKRVGVYPIDEKTLAFISAEAEKASRMINKLNNMQKRLENYEERVKGITESGKKELIDVKDSSIASVQSFIDDYKKTIETQLDDYLKTLEENLRNSSNQVFNQLLEDAREKIKGIKLSLSTLSQTTTSELLRIRSASEESVEKLRSFMDNNESLKAMLDEAKTDEQVRRAILQLQGSTETVVTDGMPSVIIPGHERLVVPATPEVVMPSSGIVTNAIIPAFDERIPFDERIEKIREEMARREAQGEIFHCEVDHVIRCLIEGDWPYLWGPSGCGKSFCFSQIAELLGLDLVDNSKITDKYSLLGYNDTQGRYRATNTFVAFYYGKLLSLDEIDNGNVDTEVLLNPIYSALIDALSHPERPKSVTFAEDMTVPVHPNFRMISGGNTSGEGENEAFSARGKIDESILQRMTPIQFNYDNRIEQKIFGDNIEWYDFFIKFRLGCDEYAKRENLSTSIGVGTTRDASAIVRYIKNNSKTIEEVMKDKFLQTKSPEYLAVLARFFQKVYDLEDTSDFEYNGTLKEAQSRVLARKFVSMAKKKMNRD